MSRSPRALRAIVATLSALALVPFAGLARARAAVELVYERSERAATCPDAPALRIEVAKRLGYDPFVEQASDGRRVVAKIDRRENGEFHGEVRVDVGEARGEGGRELDAVDCNELVASMALTTSVLLEPLAGRHRRTEPPPPSTTSLRELPELGPPPPPLPPPPPTTAIALRLGAFAVGSIAAAPSVALGFEGLAGIAIGPRGGRTQWSIDGAARFDLESGATHASHGAESSLVLGELVPCGHLGVFALCGVGDLGAFRGHVPPTATGPREQSSFYAALGPRVGLEIPIGAGFALATHADLLGVLTQTTIRVGDDELWSTPPIFFSFGGGFIRTFP